MSSSLKSVGAAGRFARHHVSIWRTCASATQQLHESAASDVRKHCPETQSVAPTHAAPSSELAQVPFRDAQSDEWQSVGPMHCQRVRRFLDDQRSSSANAPWFAAAAPGFLRSRSCAV